MKDIINYYKQKEIRKELVMKTAIQEYKNSVLFGFSRSTAHAINMMENAYIMLLCVQVILKA